MNFELLQALVQTTELQRGEKFADLFAIPGFKANTCRIDIEGHIFKQAPKLFVDTHLVCLLFESTAEFGCEFVGMGDDLLDVAVFIDELGRGFVADARNAGQIV